MPARPTASRTTTNTAPDGSCSVSLYSTSRLASVTRFDANGVQIAGTTFGYDAHGRQNTTTDARNGTTSLVFNNADLVATNTTPPPGGSGSGLSTVTTFDNMLRAAVITQPDGTVVSNVFLTTGEVGLKFGSREYPTGYGFDYAGRAQSMTNWTNCANGLGTRVTTWKFDGNRGWLTNKVYDGGAPGPSYSYTPAGRPATRLWARNITTTYGYNASGDQTTVTYSDSTPGITNTFDRLGRPISVVRNPTTDTLTYNLAGQLLTESFSGGPLNGLSVTNGYDQFMRRTNLVTSISFPATYSFDAASRLSRAADGNGNTAGYSYLANSPLVSQISFTNGSAWRMTTTKQWDYLNRLTSISSTPSAPYTLPVSFNYTYNSASQRTQDTLADGSHWNFGYDYLGQVTNGVKYFSDETPARPVRYEQIPLCLRAAQHDGQSVLRGYDARPAPSAFRAPGRACSIYPGQASVRAGLL